MTSFCYLAERLGFLADFSEGKSAEDWLESFVADSEVPDYAEFRRTGIHLGAGSTEVWGSLISSLIHGPTR